MQLLLRSLGLRITLECQPGCGFSLSSLLVFLICIYIYIQHIYIYEYFFLVFLFFPAVFPDCILGRSMKTWGHLCHQGAIKGHMV